MQPPRRGLDGFGASRAPLRPASDRSRLLGHSSVRVENHDTGVGQVHEGQRECAWVGAGCANKRGGIHAVMGR
jgi:hypothetical protein